MRFYLLCFTFALAIALATHTPAQATILSPQFITPTQGVLTSGYGHRWGRMHQGIDIAAPVGTPIVAAAEGTVEFAGWNNGGFGNLVDVRHSDVSLTRYAHASQILVHTQDFVLQGQATLAVSAEQHALVGSTGRSTGSHLHFEIHLPGQGAVNPIAYLPSTVARH